MPRQESERVCAHMCPLNGSLTLLLYFASSMCCSGKNLTLALTVKTKDDLSSDSIKLL